MPRNPIFSLSRNAHASMRCPTLFRSPDFPLMFLNFLSVFRLHAKLLELSRERVLVVPPHASPHASPHGPSSAAAIPGVAHDVHRVFLFFYDTRQARESSLLFFFFSWKGKSERFFCQSRRRRRPQKKTKIFLLFVSFFFAFFRLWQFGRLLCGLKPKKREKNKRIKKFIVTFVHTHHHHHPVYQKPFPTTDTSEEEEDEEEEREREKKDVCARGVRLARPLSSSPQNDGDVVFKRRSDVKCSASSSSPSSRRRSDKTNF